MIQELLCLKTRDTDPRHNLALEAYLLERVRPGQCILYLWQNQRTVVIGRNQHAQSECRVQALEADGGRLVRRLSGGGAVYHDLGNLNFTFLTVREDYDVEKQTEAILQAVRSLGVPAERSGRNDLTAQGGKFSGHAYYRSGARCYHHGTLMVSVDLAPLERYLNVSPLKLQAKGVASVRSRVVNLRDFCPDLTIDALCEALVRAFSAVYGLPVRTLTEAELDQDALGQGIARFSDPAWIYGDTRPLDVSREALFPWGLLRLDYSLEGEVITQAAVWSDALETEYLTRVPEALEGCPRRREAVRQRLSALPDAREDTLEGILALLMEE